MIDYCTQAPTLIGHRANVLCRDGWHAVVLYTRAQNPGPEHFKGAILGAEIIFEPAKEARPLEGWPDPEGWHPYLVRFRQERS